MSLLRYLHLMLLTLPLLSTSILAAPLDPSHVPAPLKPWIGWVMHDQKEASCPLSYDDADRRFCAWPSRLKCTLTSQGGHFQQTWHLWHPAWVPLPGSRQNWPEAVRVGETTPLVMDRQGIPAIYLQAGHHALRGSFRWPSIPEFLTVPPHVGLVSLTLHGEEVPFPNLDNQGHLWLHGNREEKREEDQLTVRVHRKINDDIPATVQTRITLQVAGKNRAILLDQPLTTGLTPLQIDSRLPVRIEEDGRLRVQARPGRWIITLTLRHHGPLTTLHHPPADPQHHPSWADEEVWVFNARNHLRMVTVEGVPPIDPQQTTLPDAWKTLPAYLIRPGATLTFVEKKRGDPHPAPDRLTMERTWWLDFNGDGYTIHDRIHGRINRAWRLEMDPPQTLGRVAMDGQPQWITRLPGSEKTGIEVRQGGLTVQADSRLDHPTGTLPAIGWQQDFHALQATLNLPPGWQLFYGDGADEIHPTWVTRWTLVDLFLTLIIALTVGKLFGRRWGWLALLALTLAYHEEEHLAWPMIHLLVATALLRAKGEASASPLARWIRFYRLAASSVLITIVLLFLVEQAQKSLYPQLERVAGHPSTYHPDATARAMVQDDEAHDAPRQASRRRSLTRKTTLAQLDPNARVQTGPGLPQWHWQTIRMAWNGPVEQGQRLRLLLMPPWLNTVLNLLRMLSLALLTLLLVVPTWLTRQEEGRGRGHPPSAPSSSSPLPVLLVVLAGVTLLSPQPAQADIPSPDLLDTLQRRLLAPPSCLPYCGSLAGMHLQANKTWLSIRLEAHAAHRVALPLPGSARHWLPQQVHVNEKVAETLLRQHDGTLWIHLEKGSHTLLLEGPLPQQAVVQLPLPLPPHRLTSQLSGWHMEGMDERGLPRGSLQLRREHDPAAAAAQGKSDVTTTLLPPFARLERDLILDLTWHVENRLTRQSPRGSAMVLSIPLLPGESVTTPGMNVDKGHVFINLPANAHQARWDSILEIRPAIRLIAPREVAWTEVWRLRASPVWHLLFEGIPVIHYQDDADKRRPEWHPWPGESVTLHVTRPEGVPGNTLTLITSRLAVTPGLRATDSRLTLHWRSSQGSQHRVQLPPHAKLLSVTINGQPHPINQEGRGEGRGQEGRGQEGRGVMLPVVPGAQTMQIAWREPRGMTPFFQTPAVDLGVTGVNAHLDLHVPQGRWVLGVGGPPIGPAILFWGTLAVVLMLAIGLGHIPWLPLTSRHWIVLALGISTHLDARILVLVGWFLAMGWRGRHPESLTPFRFNLKQVILALWTLVAVMALLDLIHSGLLDSPDMIIQGNGSSSRLFHWYLDHADAGEPVGWLLSVPLVLYQLSMLLWSFWLAAKLLVWGPWAWGCFSQGGRWKTAPLPPPASQKPT